MIPDAIIIIKKGEEEKHPLQAFHAHEYACCNNQRVPWAWGSIFILFREKQQQQVVALVRFIIAAVHNNSEKSVFLPPFLFWKKKEKKKKKVYLRGGMKREGGKWKWDTAPLLYPTVVHHTPFDLLCCCSIFFIFTTCAAAEIFNSLYGGINIWPTLSSVAQWWQRNFTKIQQTASIRRSIGGDTGVHTTQRVVTQRVRKCNNTIQRIFPSFFKRRVLLFWKKIKRVRCINLKSDNMEWNKLTGSAVSMAIRCLLFPFGTKKINKNNTIYCQTLFSSSTFIRTGVSSPTCSWVEGKKITAGAPTVRQLYV